MGEDSSKTSAALAAGLVPVGSRRFQAACTMAVIKVTLAQNDRSLFTDKELTHAIAQLLLAVKAQQDGS